VACRRRLLDDRWTNARGDCRFVLAKDALNAGPEQTATLRGRKIAK
jgi:hypothetical protein